MPPTTLRRSGGRAMLAAVVGRDDPARRLVAALHKRVDSRRVLRAAGHPTALKTRILAGGIHSPKQQVVRIDRGVSKPIDASSRKAFEHAALDLVTRVDAVLVSDYGSGLVSPSLVSKLRMELKRSGHPVPILIDSRYRLLEYSRLTVCTPNESEVEQALGVHINDNRERSSKQAVKSSIAHEWTLCSSPAAAAAWRSLFATRRRRTFRSSGPTQSWTSPAPAIPSWRRWPWRWGRARHSKMRPGWRITPAGWW
jgi:bifunctional ADP-heptose synthase (sugar kinase/adenylyltransferase)